MPERRQPGDRRANPLRFGEGRRKGERPHGSRAMYQTGCRCLLCKAANAEYERIFRKAHRDQKPLLGAKMSALEAWRIIEALKIEKMTNSDIARALGLRRPILELHPDIITVRNHLRLRRLSRQFLIEPGDPNVSNV